MGLDNGSDGLCLERRSGDLGTRREGGDYYAQSEFRSSFEGGGRRRQYGDRGALDGS